MNLINALQTKNTFTENGMVTNSSSGKALVDMFFHVGAMRKNSPQEITKYFVDAYAEHPLLAIKGMFYNRNIRGGQGERRSFRIMFEYLCKTRPEVAIKNLENVVKFGRWDDLFVAVGTDVEPYAFDLMLSALKNKDKLCGKWMPRENKHNHSIYLKLLKAWNLSPKSYRELVAGNTQVVETLMCKRQWQAINYSHVPSKASSKYRKAFMKHDETGYKEYLSKLEKGDKSVKINAGAIFPSDVIKPYLPTNGGMSYRLGTLDRTVEAQWKALPNYVSSDLKRALVIADTSGSMAGEPIQVCISLAIYLAERNLGVFKDHFITFSANPVLQKLTGETLLDKVSQLTRSQWDTNTNLNAVFDLILIQAVKHSVPKDEMPSDLVIISDMQFDSAGRFTAKEMIERKYAMAGYELPNIVWWNVRSSNGVPVSFNDKGMALVSGYSPSIMQAVFSKEMTPLGIVEEILNNPVYDSVVL